MNNVIIKLNDDSTLSKITLDNGMVINRVTKVEVFQEVGKLIEAKIYLYPKEVIVETKEENINFIQN